MKYLIAMLLASALCGAALADNGEVRCLVSSDARTPVRLQFELPEGKRRTASVAYQRGSGKIMLRHVETSSVETAPGRPFEFTTTWAEGPRGAPGGTYTVVTQGARIYGFTYVRARDGKRFVFDEDPAALTGPGCSW